MPTGPDCSMSFDECVAWASGKEGIDDPEGYCGAQEQK
mgnify:FL=1